MKKITFLLLFTTFVLSSTAQNLALDFDGTSEQYIETSSMVPLTDSFTVMGWVYARAAHTKIFSWGSPNVNKYIQIKTNFNGTFQIYSGGGVINLYSTTSILNGWHHFAVTNNSGSVTIYVDGVNEGTASADFSAITPTKTTLGSALINGTMQGSGNFQIDEFSVWDIALSGEDILKYKSAPPVGEETGLVLAYNFDPEGAAAEGDNTAITTINSLTWNYNGTLTGFSLNGSSSNYVERPSESLSISEVRSEKSVSIYPNPTKDFFKVNGFDGQLNYVIYNAVGLKVKSGRIYSNSPINIKPLSNGVYFVHLENSSLLKFIKN